MEKYEEITLFSSVTVMFLFKLLVTDRNYNVKKLMFVTDVCFYKMSWFSSNKICEVLRNIL